MHVWWFLTLFACLEVGIGQEELLSGGGGVKIMLVAWEVGFGWFALEGRIWVERLEGIVFGVPAVVMSSTRVHVFLNIFYLVIIDYWTILKISDFNFSGLKASVKNS